MRKLPLSTMLMEAFAGILAALMLVCAALLGILVGLNAARGDSAANPSLIVTALLFLAGAGGFFLLRRWARGLSRDPQSRETTP